MKVYAALSTTIRFLDPLSDLPSGEVFKKDDI